jgi:hypothetical protein
VDDKETIKAVKSILSSPSILCDFSLAKNELKDKAGEDFLRKQCCNMACLQGQVLEYTLFLMCGERRCTGEFLKMPVRCRCGDEKHTVEITWTAANAMHKEMEKTCSYRGCKKKRTMTRQFCIDPRQYIHMTDTVMVECPFCGRTLNVMKRSMGKGTKVQGCTREQNKCCFTLCRAKNSSGEHCDNPRIQLYCGKYKCQQSGPDFGSK